MDYQNIMQLKHYENKILRMIFFKIKFLIIKSNKKWKKGYLNKDI
jgi:hypothetical protein